MTYEKKIQVKNRQPRNGPMEFTCLTCFHLRLFAWVHTRLQVHVHAHKGYLFCGVMVVVVALGGDSRGGMG